MSKCTHGMYCSSVCAACKGWPSIDTMRQQFPKLTEDFFLVMTPDERIKAVKTGNLDIPTEPEPDDEYERRTR